VRKFELAGFKRASQMPKWVEFIQSRYLVWWCKFSS